MAQRKVFYIPGYDPFPPRRYREIYRTEASLQGDASGHVIRVVGGRGQDSHRWQVEAVVEGAQVHAEVEVLIWSDLVRGSMGQGIAQTYLGLVRTAWIYLGSGALWRLMRLRKGPMIAALYPVAVLLGELVLAILLALFMARSLPAAGWTGTGVGLAVFAGTVWGALWVFRASDRRLYAWYLMHDYAFSASGAGAWRPDLAGRMEGFAARIGAAAAEGWDEVLVVGHSSGAHLGVSVLAGLVRGGGWPAEGPVLSFLTLGQVVPMISFLPAADGLRADLHFLSRTPTLTWVDVTAPGDGCSFALCDPVAVSGQGGAGKRWPLVLSAAFSRTLSPGRWQALRRRWFRLHFQYLCAFDNLNGRRDEYDYFAVTAGPLTLSGRLGGRAASKSRIETPLNPYGAAR